MDDFDFSEWFAAHFILVVGGAFLVLLLIACLVWRQVFFQPYADSAFNSQVQGLVTEYCTAPRSDDQEAARQQLKQLIDGKPDEFSTLPTALQTTAQEVYNDQRKEACQ